jgi:hypothetical protein
MSKGRAISTLPLVLAHDLILQDDNFQFFSPAHPSGSRSSLVRISCQLIGARSTAKSILIVCVGLVSRYEWTGSFQFKHGLFALTVRERFRAPACPRPSPLPAGAQSRALLQVWNGNCGLLRTKCACNLAAIKCGSRERRQCRTGPASRIIPRAHKR